MRKLTAKTWYDIKDDHAVIYAIRKDTQKRVAAFTCHTSCIDVIKRTGSLLADNVILRPIAQV